MGTPAKDKKDMVQFPPDEEIEKIIPYLEKDELAAINGHKRLRERKFVHFKNGKPEIEGDRVLTSLVLMDDLKTTSPEVSQLVHIAASSQVFGNDQKDRNLEHALAQIRDLAPQTPLESMLVRQMIAVDGAINKIMRDAMDDNQFRDNRVQGLNAGAKLQRTFLSQVETLQKLQGKGPQVVRVERVTVNEGGQAIVGHVEHKVRGGGGSKDEK